MIAAQAGVYWARVDEREIVEGCRRGDADALKTLAERNYDRLFRVACALTRDPGTAEDLTQQTFTASIAAIRGFRGESSLFTWLVAILRRANLNRRRSEERRRRIERPPPEPEEAERRDARAELAAALEKLDEESRIILSLYHVEEMSYEEIAGALDVPLGTVKSRMHEARKRLRNLVEGRHAV
jgi:RNA polymerase sigma-70 factor (ECF subfamily)